MKKNDDMYEMISLVNQHLPPNRARYLMGVGTPENILRSIELGVDMFDCVLPSRNARHGLLYTHRELSISKTPGGSWIGTSWIPGLPAGYALPYSKSYLRHLIQSNEIWGPNRHLQNLSFFLYLSTNSP